MASEELSIEGFCAYFGISRRTVYRAVQMGVIPPPLYDKRNARYGPVHIRAYTLARKRAQRSHSMTEIAAGLFIVGGIYALIAEWVMRRQREGK